MKNSGCFIHGEEVDSDTTKSGGPYSTGDSRITGRERLIRTWLIQSYT